MYRPGFLPPGSAVLSASLTKAFYTPERCLADPVEPRAQPQPLPILLTCRDLQGWGKSNRGPITPLHPIAGGPVPSDIVLQKAVAPSSTSSPRLDTGSGQGLRLEDLLHAGAALVYVRVWPVESGQGQSEQAALLLERDPALTPARGMHSSKGKVIWDHSGFNKRWEGNLKKQQTKTFQPPNYQKTPNHQNQAATQAPNKQKRALIKVSRSLGSSPRSPAVKVSALHVREGWTDLRTDLSETNWKFKCQHSVLVLLFKSKKLRDIIFTKKEKISKQK